MTPPFVRCPSTAVVTATGRHAKVLQHQSPDLLYVELDGNENAEGPAFERKTIRSSDVTVLAANPVDFRQSVGGCTALHALCGFNSSRAAMAVVKAHLARLTATFAPKLRLPARPARLVAEYWGHVGFY